MMNTFFRQQNKALYIGVLMMIFPILFSCNKNNSNKQLLAKFKPFIYKSSVLNKKLPYRFFIPENIEGIKKYPLILILHGGYQRGSDNKKQLGIPADIFSSEGIQEKNPCFILVPQCPEGEQWLNTTFKKIPFDNYRQEDIPESNSMKMIIEIIKSLINEYPVDRTRLYVTGLSMGGSGTWDIITRYPDLFAAAVPVTGVSDPSKAAKIKDMPIWAFHGSKDPVTPVQVTRNMINALRGLNGNIKFTEYKDKDHNSWDAAYNEKEMLKWIFKQKK